MDCSLSQADFWKYVIICLHQQKFCTKGSQTFACHYCEDLHFSFDYITYKLHI